MRLISWLRTSGLFLLIMLPVTGTALESMRATTSKPLINSVKSATRVTSNKPIIQSVSPVPCVAPNNLILINGEQLLDSQYQLVARVTGRHVPLKIKNRSVSRIEAFVPDAKTLEPGKTYSVVLVDMRTRAVVSNTSKRIQICASTAAKFEQSSSLQATVSRQPERSISSATDLNTQPVYSQASQSRLDLPQSGEIPEIIQKQDDSYEAAEVIILSKTMADARKLEKIVANEGYRIKRRRVLKHLGYVLNVVGVPKYIKVSDALKQLQKRDKSLLTDANHRYRLQGTVKDKNNLAVHQSLNWGTANKTCGKGIKLGIVDSLVDASYPGFLDNQINNKSFLPRGVISADRQHATAIASILVSQPDASVKGLLPAAKVYVAGVFRLTKAKQIETTAELIVTGLNWLYGKGVDVINLSIAGPRNQLLEASIRQLLKHNTLIAAAVGNNSYENVDMYPAAIEGVAAVTAVDARNRIYKQANRGKFVMVAAPGVDIWAARSGDEAAFVSGTSYATPYITAALAVIRQRHTAPNAGSAISQLIEKTKDLGEPGRDITFGQGLLQFKGCE